MIGSRLPRLEDHPFLTGRGCFVDDIAITEPLHAAFVRSPHPHALIRAVRSDAARVLPGVFAVLTLGDIAPAMAKRRMVRTSNSGTPLDRCWAFALADGEVSYVGEPVALVLAANRYVAEDAVALVEVDYEVLASAADCRKAALAGAAAVRREGSSNVISSYRLAYGDIDVAFRDAAHIFREGFWPHRGGAHSIEGRGIAVESRKSDGSLIVYASTQKAHDLFNTLASLLGLDENRLRVATPDVGGGFGPKLCVYAEDVAVVASAKLLGRSVKWVEDRREHFLNAVQERDQHWSMEIALDAAGRILGLRGAGYPQASFVMERLMDIAAYELGLDRAELRRRNLIPAAKMPYTKPLKTRAGATIVYDSGDYPACQAAVVAAADWDAFPARQALARAGGRLIGLGLGHAMKGTGRGPFESGVVRISP